VLEVCGATKGSVGDALGVDGVKRVENLSIVGSCSFSLAEDGREWSDMDVTNEEVCLFW
jgi:hypothetical protein